MYGPDKLEYLSLPNLFCLRLCNTLAYWAYLKVTKEMNCCEYGPPIIWYAAIFLSRVYCIKLIAFVNNVSVPVN